MAAWLAAWPSWCSARGLNEWLTVQQANKVSPSKFANVPVHPGDSCASSGRPAADGARLQNVTEGVAGDVTRLGADRAGAQGVWLHGD
jgi:hypothetical protein